eukprot:jgi/Picsp_1/459/NSC_00457-R1_prefoldin-related ke2-like protein
MATSTEDKRDALVELSQKTNEHSSRLRQAESQKRQLEIEIRRAAFTAAHLQTMADSTVTYTSVGKAYLQEPKNAILSNLEESVRAKDSELKSVKVAIENLEKTRANVVKEIQELQKSI